MRFTALLTAMTAVATSVVSAAPATGAAAACSDLLASLPKSVLIQTSPTYTPAQNGGFNPLNNKLSPSCIVQPTSASDVATAMRAVFKHKANYAVRSGGHTGMGGWDSTDGGVLLDFSLMRDFSYSSSAGTVTVGPGLRWGEVYNMSEAYGVAPLGGRVYHVGTGLVLGGGLSLLSPQYGYACDGLVSADIVTVDGRIRTVNAQTDPQLLRAIKGGGGRFGVVTKYELRAFPTGRNSDKNWYGGSITVLTPTGIDQMVEYSEDFVATPDDPKATLLSNVGMLKQAGVPVYLGTTFAFYKGGAEDFNRVFGQFLAIPGAIVDVKPISYLEATQVTPLGWKPTQAYKWIGGSHYAGNNTTPLPLLPTIPVLNEPTPTKFLGIWRNVQALIVKHVDVLESAFFSITPVGTTQIDQGYAAGGNAIAPPQGRNFMHYLFSNILADGTTDFPADFEADRQQFIKDNPSDAGLPLFLNEVDATQEAFKSYGWYDQLKRQYKRFDPTGFSLRFQQGPTF
ncbi:FAD linked oxidase, N-terminal [Kalmanozyma brasiliensis GHG001]|uniref:FAD-binding PCMH-type domain-containing protein n=1 Tax=Kalmanozyma brasiliensis (strain GHG001) TaxID=1365824 RepID=V5EYF9_KALBG|nr:FAD linked oxidase, N-terminal [Kalmanozyma brasiliensis GHG001]EST08778.1 FAD linked oxidase, N-terminal [Kalmanozyma brasiliensis GHG001]